MSPASFRHVRSPAALAVALLAGAWAAAAVANPPAAPEPDTATAGCPARPPPGSVVAEPEDLDSVGGVLRTGFTFRNVVDADGATRYCYVSADGGEAPTLRLKAGDRLVLRLKDELQRPRPDAPLGMSMSLGKDPPAGGAATPGETRQIRARPTAGGCTATAMNGASTNLHFHGLSVPPTCHQDDVLRTVIQSGAPPFEYRFRIPRDEPPGLNWYHPHVHGLTTAQVLGGASGALVIEGSERIIPELAGLPERVFVIRDQALVHPDAAPVATDSMPAPLVLRDAEGDILNTGTGTGKPARDLSINFVPVAYPDYLPAKILMRPLDRQLWRIVNGSSVTYLDLQVLFGDRAQGMGVVAWDGVPIDSGAVLGHRIIWQSHILLPPAGRVEAIVRAPPEGVRASLVTRTVDTGPAGENDPTRPLAALIADPAAPAPRRRLGPASAPSAAAPAATRPWLGGVTPARTRKLYFSERPRDPRNPNGPVDFYLTVDGETPKLFDPSDRTPDIVTRQGDVEDWVVENRTRELHAFHIHQIHFLLVDYNGVPLDEPFLRDTINVAYWDGVSRSYPSVKLRMDFRDPNTVGTFVYHCHLLEHEDGGMMGIIRVDPGPRRHRSAPPARAAVPAKAAVTDR